jgi:hypothetical protein
MRAVAILMLNVASLHATEISYNRDVRPILSDNCFACHGFDPKNRKADLRLDTFEGATSDGAIVPGDVAKSEVWSRIITGDEDEIMPPPKSHKTLTAAQKNTLKRWIESGAKYETHWSFMPLAVVRPPEVKTAAWAKNDLDRFILARLESEGLKPSAEATKENLIRRLSLDLTGLPPTLAEVDAFVADTSPQAFEKVVDRLLKSPHYGERMALDWLDAARYADSNGYQVDRDREMWPWRDWVIAAFNDNMRFDQFTIEQLAGDLLPGATLTQRIATGFNRNHMTNEEGGIIPEEFLAEYTADRVETTAAVWLGQTFNCCRCHDHKYDPFTAKDFYSLKAFFHNVPEQGVGNRKAKPNASAPPVITAPSPSLDAKKAVLEKQRAELQSQRDTAASQSMPGLDAWTQRVQANSVRWKRLGFLSVTGAGLPSEIDAGAVKVGIQVGDDFWNFKATTAPQADRITAIRLVGEVIGEETNFRINHVDATALTGSKQAPLGLRASAFEDSLPVKVLQPLLKPGNRAPHNLRIQLGKSESAVFLLREPLQPAGPAGLVVTVGARANTGSVRWHLEVTADEPDLLVPASIQAIATKAASNRSSDELQVLQAAYAATLPEMRRLDDAILALDEQLGDLDLQYPASMVMEEMMKPRDTFILMRGAYDKPGEKVTAATPAVLPAMAADLPRNRLGLAKWLVSAENPLTARVVVNRFWQQLFGTGLVKTSEDFGAQGESPSHPELLDWLASEFIRSGWDVKQLMRLIVSSATYRQQSQLSLELLSKDPENRLLARGPRLRLPGELIRDQALTVSGLLVPTLGGPPLRPYHPAGMYETMAPTSADTVKTYLQDRGDALYRRSLYTYWKRSIPHPAMLAFGTPFREVCTLQRPRSNTPLQALNLMNDPTYVEAARFLAERMIREGGESTDSRLRHGFRLVLARPPSASHLAVLKRAFEKAQAHYRAEPAAAKALLTHGEKSADSSLDPIDHAAFTNVASTLLCLDEVVTKQ